MGRKSILCVVCLMLLLIVSANGQNPPEAKPGNGLLLTIAVDLDAPATNLIFEARNAGDKDIHTTPIGASGNWIEVVRPDGKTIDIQVDKDILGPVVLKPGETKTWHYDLAGWVKFDVPGRYRVTWHLWDLRNLGKWKAEIVLVKSKAAAVGK